MVRNCTSGNPRPCAPARGELNTLREIVDAYIRDYRDEAGRELHFFAIQRTLADAVRPAAMCELPGGKRHPHQRRIPHDSLHEATQRLLSMDLGDARSFDELHDAVATAIGDIHMIGPLAIYDIAHRIGAFLSLAPERVYLHRGTRDGARALGLGRGRKTLAIDELPREFRRLSAAEIEDCLCIYKAQIGRTCDF
jgi:hypothetical protein